MSEPTQPQAIMFEPTDDLELRAGRGETGTGEHSQEREQITFERGYEELKVIVSRLDDPELPVHEMFEGFRRGKGLEKALRAYLQEREGELTELEEGNNLPEFEIAAPSNGKSPAAP
ncbi:MAG: exodeoxyribonuclease VII small subunit [Solirubrobacteraceae bacterium]